MEASAVNPGPARLIYLTAMVSHDGIAELHGASRTVSVPKSDITSIELAHGIGAERPILQTIVGLVIFGIGVSSISDFVKWLTLGGKITGFRIYLSFSLILGASLLYAALRKRTYLLVRTPRDARKILLKGRIDPTELAEFIDRARNDFDYAIRSTLPNSIA